jgi:hypothetical protein
MTRALVCSASSRPWMAAIAAGHYCGKNGAEAVAPTRDLPAQ